MKIAITGATGFIGKHLVEELIKEGFNDLKILVCNDATFLKKRYSFLKIIKGDLLKGETLTSFVKDVDLVYHLAGIFLGDYKKLFDINVVTTLNLMEACKDNKVKKVVFTSSGVVYKKAKQRPSQEDDAPKPDTNHGLMKVLAEQIIKYYSSSFDIKSCILRFPSVYGPGNQKGVIYHFIKDILNKNEVTIYGDGKQKRDFLYISDAIDALVKCSKYKTDNLDNCEIFNIASAKIMNLLELLDLLKEITDKEFKINFKEPEAHVVDVLWENFEKAKKILNWQPKISLEEGLRITTDFLKL